MKREFLNELLKDIKEEDRKAIVDKIMEQNGTDVNNAKGDTKKLEDDIKTLKGEKKSLETQLTTANDTIEDLKKSNPDVEGLQKKIKEHEDTIKKLEDDHKAEVTKMKREAIATEILGKYKAKNSKSVKALIDDFEAKDDEDFKTLFDSKVKALSEADDTKFLFGEVQQQQHYDPAGGGDEPKGGLGLSFAESRNATVTPAFDPWGSNN